MRGTSFKRGFVACLGTALFLAAPAGAATIPVSVTNDTGSGGCSLREAVDSANQDISVGGCAAGDNGAVDTITLSATAGGDTYTLTGVTLDQANAGGDLDITGSDPGVVIKGDSGPGGGPIDHISGNGADRVIDVVSSEPFILDTVIVEGGNPPPGSFDVGGGIFGGSSGSGGPVTIQNSEVKTSTANVGGGIDTLGPLTVTNSMIGSSTGFATGNSARVGGGISTSGGLTMNASTVSFNSAGVNITPGGIDAIVGGGISAGGPTTTITDSSIVSNRAAPTEAMDVPHGGGLVTQSTDLTMTGTTVSGNQVIGGTNGSAAGVSIEAPTAHTAKIVNSTISANTVDNTGSGTRTTGGLLAQTAVSTQLIHVTLAGNDAPLIDGIFGGPNIALKGTLIDQPGAGSCLGGLTANAFNVESGPGDCLGVTADSDSIGAAVAVSPLALNGGLTQTQSIGPTSVAVDKVPTASCLDPDNAPLSVDQRGAERPFGSACDAGAYERVTCGGDLPTFLKGPGNDTMNGFDLITDVMVGSAGDDTMNGLGGNDKVCGGSGNDTITGGTGQDQIFGDAGDDTVFAQDGAADTIDCGPGGDTATFDSGLDTVSNCNDVPAGGGGAIIPPPTKKCKKPKKKTKAAKKKFKKCKKKLKKQQG
jgi:hemolysin type calcium-binding protein